MARILVAADGPIIGEIVHVAIEQDDDGSYTGRCSGCGSWMRPDGLEDVINEASIHLDHGPEHRH